jgi:hypothetical protein
VVALTESRPPQTQTSVPTAFCPSLRTSHDLDRTRLARPRPPSPKIPHRRSRCRHRQLLGNHLRPRQLRFHLRRTHRLEMGPCPPRTPPARVDTSTPTTRTVFDWGCGSGIAARRVISFFGAENFDALTVWDHSPLATDYAATAAQAAFPQSPRLAPPLLRPHLSALRSQISDLNSQIRSVRRTHRSPRDQPRA